MLDSLLWNSSCLSDVEERIHGFNATENVLLERALLSWGTLDQ